MEHIERDAELDVLESYRDRRDVERTDLPQVQRSEVLNARRALDEGVHISPVIRECLVDLSRAVRADERVLQGNSTRSLVLLLPALQALAVLRGRDFVSAEDVEHLVPRAFGHRVELAPGIDDGDALIVELMKASLEKLARSTLRKT